MDNLTACAITAQKLGMSYGQYMAQKKGSPVIRTKEPVKVENVRYCKICGKEIDPITKRLSYCSESCSYESARRTAKEKARVKNKISEDDILICPRCGKEFVRGNNHGSRKYCTPECYLEMRKELRKRWKKKETSSSQGF